MCVRESKSKTCIWPTHGNPSPIYAVRAETWPVFGVAHGDAGRLPNFFTTAPSPTTHPIFATIPGPPHHTYIFAVAPRPISVSHPIFAAATLLVSLRGPCTAYSSSPSPCYLPFLVHSLHQYVRLHPCCNAGRHLSAQRYVSTTSIYYLPI
jgi:hypothetical protein